MRLLCALVEFPAIKLVEAAGNAPAWACLQGKCITFLPHPLFQCLVLSGELRVKVEVERLRILNSALFTPNLKWQTAVVLPHAR